MEGEGDSRETKLVDAFTVTDRLLSTQIKALEILTNLCCSADSDSLDDDQFYDSCSETSIEGGGLEESAIELNPELKAAFLQAGLFQSVVERARMPAENIIESLSQYQTGTYFFLNPRLFQHSNESFFFYLYNLKGNCY